MRLAFHAVRETLETWSCALALRFATRGATMGLVVVTRRPVHGRSEDSGLGIARTSTVTVLPTPRCAFALLTLVVIGCGGRSSLTALGLGPSPEPTSGGTPSTDAGPAFGGSSGVGGGAGLGGTSGGNSAGLGGSLGGNAGSAGGGVGGAGGEPMTRPPQMQVAIGAFHSCVSFEDGSLRCWGRGGNIGLGNSRTIGDDETPDIARDVDIGGKVVQLTASWHGTCALLETGAVRCFGSGLPGQLGYGNTDDVGDDETPDSAGDVNVGGEVKQISAGPSHTCACLADGSVRCWGQNDDWQLGYPSSEAIGDDEDPTLAGPVDVGGFVVQVAAGGGHTCVLLDTDNVRCWGAGAFGQLGYGNVETIGDDETPASAGDVDVGGPVRQVVAGFQHTCALLVDGRVRCWGRATDGRLGHGNTEWVGDDEVPASVGDVDVGNTVEQLAAGAFGTCALLANGALRCWGSGDHGQLGYGNLENLGDTQPPSVAPDVDVGGVVTQIDMGFLHTCAALESRSVRCWGRNADGQLGYGNTDDIGDDEPPSAAGDVKTH